MLLLAQVASAQAVFLWEQRPASVRPAVRTDTSISYDSARGRVVLFGGANSVRLADTWEWDGTQWAQQSPTHNPPALSSTRAVYDSARRQTVNFGGNSSGGDTSHTWLWDGSDWVDPAPALRPPARNSHAMAFDSLRNRVVLFGGAFGGVGATYADTWEWDGTNWAQRSPGNSPPMRARHAMAFDAARGRVVLYGGTSETFAYLADTWEWDGTNWTRRTPAHSPGSRWVHAMAYDATRQRVILFGGHSGGDRNDTWEWDGVDWVRRVANNPPSPRVYSTMAYDGGRDRLVVFGGGDTSGPLNDLWELRQDDGARYNTFGAGCAGWAGVPYLATDGAVPSVGHFFSVYARNLPPDHGAMMWIGASRTATYGFTLPLAMGFAGMPGCVLYVSLDVAMPMFNWSGAAAWTVMLPNEPAMLGVRFYNQAFAIDRVANPLGAILTNAGEGVIGR